MRNNLDKILDQIIIDAYQSNASDIHIEHSAMSEIRGGCLD